MLLLKDNDSLIDRRINKVIIDKFVQLLVRYRNHEHLKIIRKMVKSRERIIHKNQREITALLINEPRNRAKFLFSLSERKGRVFVSLPLIGWDQLDFSELNAAY